MKIRITLLIIFAGVLLLHTTNIDAQSLNNCRTLDSCSTAPTSNGCTQELHWTQCDGTNGSRYGGCQNVGCTAQCNCTCVIDGDPPGQDWIDTCNGNTLHVHTFGCDGCPTPTPTPTPPTEPGCPGAQIKPQWFTYCEAPWTEDTVVTYYCCPPDDSCSETHGLGWYKWQGTNQCVPPECLACQMNGGTQCPGGNCWTPVLIDIEGDGFSLTNKANGIRFRPQPGIPKIQTAWTTASSDDAWLALDRNGNGEIDDATELFSCSAPQPTPRPGQIGNGFIALAEFDKTSNGGNGDGLITKEDTVFNKLRLWRDSNHNGKSQNSELFKPNELGLKKIDLDYSESRKTDQHGNKFKYRARVRDANDAQLGRWAYDIFLVAGEN